MIAGAVWLSGCGGAEREAARSSISDATVFRVSEHNSGAEVRSASVSKGDPNFEELVHYIRDPAATEGERSLVSYVPALTVECDTIRINFLEETVVVSTRASAQESWSQRTRAMTADDEQARAILKERLDQSNE